MDNDTLVIKMMALEEVERGHDLVRVRRCMRYEGYRVISP
jgi:hypothetical protein